MAFKVKDLLINVLPSDEDLPGGILSRFPCNCGCTYGYTVGCGPTWRGMICPDEGSVTGHPTRVLVMAACPPGSILCVDPKTQTNPPTGLLLSPLCCPMTTAAGPAGGDPAAAAQQLAALKSQLRDAIAEIEKREKVVNELAQPQTAAEIEDLQSKLKEALDELERRKLELKKK